MEETIPDSSGKGFTTAEEPDYLIEEAEGNISPIQSAGPRTRQKEPRRQLQRQMYRARAAPMSFRNHVASKALHSGGN